MAYKVFNIMEKVGSTQPGVIIEAIREAFTELAIDDHVDQKVDIQDITINAMEYPIPSDVTSNVRVSVLYSNGDTELLDSSDMTIAPATTNWTNGDFGIFSVASNNVAVAATATSQYCYLNDDVLNEGYQYRFEYDANITSGTYELQGVTTSIKYGDFVNDDDQVMDFTAAADTQIKIVATSSPGTATFDNFSLMVRGENEYRTAARIIGEIPRDVFDREV